MLLFGKWLEIWKGDGVNDFQIQIALGEERAKLFFGNLEIKICTGKPSMTRVWIFSRITQFYPMF